MFDPQSAKLESLEVGAVPLVAHFLEALDVEAILERHVPAKSLGRPRELPPARVLNVMLANILLSRLPLYAVPQWLGGFVPEHFGITAGQQQFFNDDRIGRTLDLLFEANLSSLVTDVVTTAIRKFKLDLGQLHNDSTTVTFHGEYQNQDRSRGKQPPSITFGYNKDHRPDLKQLLYELSITADGAVPIYFRLHDGNVTDDQTHAETWRMLKEIVGSANFIYVADSKLCVKETMQMIAGDGGTFLTVLPRTRAEDKWFLKYMNEHLIEWQEVRREPNPRQKNGPDVVYEGYESPQGSQEGFRIFWYRSSQKREQDAQRRFKKMTAARVRLEALESRTGRHRLRSKVAAEEEADRILKELKVERFLKVSAVERRFDQFVQDGPGRPGKNTSYRRDDVVLIGFNIQDDHDALQEAAHHDGLFPLITNSKSFTLTEALEKYKYQPFLEKRHEQLKNVLDVAPVFLKKPQRVAALLLLYFLALVVYSLVEREVRRAMKRRRINSLPLYPEQRLCRAPTADLIADAFVGCRRHRLLGTDGQPVRIFHDPLPEAAHTLLELLAIDPQHYGINP